MRTLDEVIKSLENNCTKCGNCAYAEETYCGEKLRQDALHYLETWKLIVESERKARKADVPANPPLTWDELCRIDMIGEPVWNGGTRRWMLLIDSGSDNTWIDLVNHSGGRERWIEHDLRKAPLYRKPKEK